MRRGTHSIIVVTMTTTSETKTIETATAERLSERFHEVFTTFDAGEDAFAPDVFCDLNMPEWRFQLQGREAFAAQIAHINEAERRVGAWCTVASERFRSRARMLFASHVGFVLSPTVGTVSSLLVTAISSCVRDR